MRVLPEAKRHTPRGGGDAKGDALSAPAVEARGAPPRSPHPTSTPAPTSHNNTSRRRSRLSAAAPQGGKRAYVTNLDYGIDAAVLDKELRRVFEARSARPAAPRRAVPRPLPAANERLSCACGRCAATSRPRPETNRVRPRLLHPRLLRPPGVRGRGDPPGHGQGVRGVPRVLPRGLCHPGGPPAGDRAVRV